MNLHLSVNSRGFTTVGFLDRYNEPCILQQSSLATEPAIWFGLHSCQPKILASMAKALGVETDQTTGWVPYPIPEAVSLTTRMHLTQNQVKELLPILQHFAETGELPRELP